MATSLFFRSIGICRCLLGLFFVIVGIINAAPAVAQSSNSIDNVYKQVESKIVQLTVVGRLDGQDLKTRKGVGCAYQTATGIRIITAKHVVGEDVEFDQVDGSQTERERDIRISVPTPFGAGPVAVLAHAIRVHTSMDVADVFPPAAEAAAGLYISMQPLKSNDRVIVISWPPDHERPVPTEALIMPHEAKDGPLVRLSKEFFEGDSGSPVVDSRGALVAIILTKTKSDQSNSTTLALPLAEVKDWLSPGYTDIDSEAAQQQKRQLSSRLKSVIGKMRAAQTAHDEVVLPAVNRYEANPSRENWDAVLYAARQSLVPVEEGIRLSRQYDAQLTSMGQEVIAELATIRSDVIGRSYTTEITGVRDVWDGSTPDKREIQGQQQRLPSMEEATRWEEDLEQGYGRLADLLATLNTELSTCR